MYNYKDIQTVSLEGKRFYQVNDETFYPSITTILGNTMSEEKQEGLKKWQAWLGKEKADQVRDEAARRGTQIHLLIEKFLKGESIITANYLKSDIALFNALKMKLRKINRVYAQEVALYSDLLQIAGRCDLIGEFEEVPSIVDYKTSTKNKTSEQIEDYWLQAAFYAVAHNEMFGTNITQLVILMTVEQGMPLVFKKQLNEELVDKLMDRVDEFYRKL
jgi:hypothetical protein